MFVKNEFYYGHDEELKVETLEMPYKNSKISMVILLPFESNGIKDLEKNLNYKKLREILSRKNMIKKNIEVTMPRFKIEFEKNLNEIAKEVRLKLKGMSH